MAAKSKVDVAKLESWMALDRRVVANSEAGSMEWWLVPRDDGILEWVPLLEIGRAHV